MLYIRRCERVQLVFATLYTIVSLLPCPCQDSTKRVLKLDDEVLSTHNVCAFLYDLLNFLRSMRCLCSDTKWQQVQNWNNVMKLCVARVKCCKIELSVENPYGDDASFLVVRVLLLRFRQNKNITGSPEQITELRNIRPVGLQCYPKMTTKRHFERIELHFAKEKRQKTTENDRKTRPNFGGGKIINLNGVHKNNNEI